MKFLDLFAGIGGFRMGLEQVGHECVGWVEWDKFARKSYQAIHDTTNEWTETDINNVKAEELPQSDIWCFGFPFQDISVAGKQGGFTNGKRSSLFFTVTGLIRQLKEEDRPSYLLIENVKNLLSINGGWDFLKLQIELGEIGYDVEWDVLDSAEVVPQHRERVYIIGHLRGRSTRKVFPISRENGETDKSDKAVNQIGNMQGGGQEPKIVVKDNKIDMAIGSTQKNASITDGTYSPTLTSAMGMGGGQTPLIVKQVGNLYDTKSFGGNPKIAIREATKKGYAEATAGDSVNISQPNSKTRRGRVGKQIANTLETSLNQGVVIPVITPDRINKRQNGRRFKEDGDPEFTLTAQDRHGVLTNNYDEIKQVASSVEKYANIIRPNAKPIVRITNKKDIRGSRQDSKKSGLSELQFTNPSNKSSTVIASHAPKTWDKDLRIRKLTPKECWRLQGFPDWAFDKAQEVNSNSQLYKQAGNSVTVPVIKAIAEKLSEKNE